MKRFLECLIPVTVCNLECDYCYVIQEKRRKMQMPEFKYSAEHIAKGLSVDRLGGVSYISICGAGETLAPKETLDIVYALLKEGHYINITTNGTLTARFKEIITWPSEFLSRLHFAFSLHYLELLRLNLLDIFFKNIQRVRESGCSFLVQINLYDGYVPYWDEIKQVCEQRVGGCPQVAVTRNEETSEISFHTEGKTEDYIAQGRKFNSPLWEFTLKNFMVFRHEYCYAGEWSATLNLCTGEMSGCYGNGIRQNIFKDVTKPIRFEAIGKNCCSPFCMNSSHFLALGCIPDLKTPSYAELRDRKEAGWYSEVMYRFLSGKLSDENKKHSWKQMQSINRKMAYLRFVRKMKSRLAKIIKSILRK